MTSDDDNVTPMPGRQTVIGRLLNIVAEQDNEIDRLRHPDRPIAVNLPEGVPKGALGFKDMDAAFNMRAWLQKACEAHGAKMTGGSFGDGVADISIELDGHKYWLTIKAI